MAQMQEMAAERVDREFVEDFMPRWLEAWNSRDADSVLALMAEDIVIWENKKYWTRPVLCDGDGDFGTSGGHGIDARGGDAINGALAVLAFPSIGGARWALLGLLAMGSGLELVQIVLPTRSGSWIDVGANALGLCGGAIWLLRRKGNDG